jgi:hypothetical protein
MEMSGRSVGLEGRSELLGGRTDTTMGKGEFQLRVMELSHRHTSAVLGRHGSGTDDLDGLAAGAMTTSHIGVCNDKNRGKNMNKIYDH